MNTVANLSNLLSVYNIKNVLSDKTGKEMLRNEHDLIKKTLKNVNKEQVISMLSDLEHDYFLEKYDLIICTFENLELFKLLFHKALFILVLDNNDNEASSEVSSLLLKDIYEKVSEFEGHVLYRNDFHSIIFKGIDLSVYDQTYRRDKPYRFLMKILEFAKKIEIRNVIEIGAARSPLNHKLEDLNPICCNDSHSTFFWAKLDNARVNTCDINMNCKRVIQEANEAGFLEFGHETTLKVHIKDGIEFLEEYARKKSSKLVDFIMFDAWDIIPGSNYAEKHLEAYHAIKTKLSEHCLISIDDTDICNGGKGKLLIPELLQDGYIILYKGRHTILKKN
jgi:hypothetical protein